MSVYAVMKMERSLLSAIQPLTGTRATGSAVVKALAADVVLPRNTYGIPVIRSATGAKQVDQTKLVKVAADTVVTAAGVNVPIFSMLGGTEQNLPATSEIIWDPGVTGVETRSPLLAALAGGTNSVGPGALKRAVSFEGLSAQDTQGLFGGGLGQLPAVVVSWEGADPADRAGNARAIRKHRWRIYVVVSRQDSALERMHDGKVALDWIAGIFTDRQAIDGENLSAPQTALGPSGRLAFGAQALVYFLDVFVSHTDVKIDGATYTAWTKTRVQMQTTPADPALNPPVITTIDESFNQ